MFGGTRIVAGSYFIGLKRAGTLAKGAENILGLHFKCHDERSTGNVINYWLIIFSKQFWWNVIFCTNRVLFPGSKIT